MDWNREEIEAVEDLLSMAEIDMATEDSTSATTSLSTYTIMGKKAEEAYV